VLFLRAERRNRFLSEWSRGMHVWVYVGGLTTMTSTSGDGKLAQLYGLLKSGQLSRREFIERAVALGVALPVLTFVVNSLDMKGASAAPSGSGKPAVARQQAAATRPMAPADQTRGAGGELKILQWQGVTTLSLHQSQGTKDQLGASLITEGLMSYMPDGSLVPTLVKEVPSVENGGLSEDLTKVTYHLLEGVLWSDGEPFTSADVVATYNWIMDPANGLFPSPPMSQSLRSTLLMI